MPFHWSSSVLPSAIVTDSVVQRVLAVNISIKFIYRLSEKFKADSFLNENLSKYHLFNIKYFN